MEHKKLEEMYRVLYGLDWEIRLKEDLKDLSEGSQAKIYRIVKLLIDDKVKMIANLERIQNDFRNEEKSFELVC